MLPENYHPPILTIECLLFEVVDDELCVFVGRISGGPHEGRFAIPGGFCSQGETTDQALSRIMAEKAGIDTAQLGVLEHLHAFDNPHGESGQHVSIVFLAGAYRIDYSTEYRQARPRFMPLKDLPELAYLQNRVVDFGLKRLRELLLTTTIASAFLPEKFTLTALQQAYELAFAKPLDKRNFRKKFLMYDVLADTGETNAGGAHRPAKLYRFVAPGVHPLQAELL